MKEFTIRSFACFNQVVVCAAADLFLPAHLWVSITDGGAFENEEVLAQLL